MPVAKPKILVDRVATNAIIERLPELMKAREMEVNDLVCATGINKSTIYALLDKSYPSELGGDKMAAIAVALDLTLTELTGI